MKELGDFTVERLQAFIDKPLDNGFTRDEQMELVRIALAAKTAEPVGSFHIYEGQVDGTTDYVKDGEWPIDTGELLVYAAPVLNSPVIPDGWKLVPVEPTESMVIDGFESEAWDALGDAVLDKKGWPYSCRESAECVTGIFKAMLAASPTAPTTEKQDGEKA
ncbi:hypothetical protein [Serratia sp. JSRIV006]|uniref:hypothetical protein n=1 Tax=Serratia sp. JSRIV006 TaxID=2831896 RepID=UPI001CBC490A|nr:hypothetical protein [Serratia sp. JSRIV006]UAN64278.1 hypothetical protein KGP16_06800 [Serratia sp. JSRIV006]